MCVLISSAFQVVFHSVAQTAIVAYAAQWPDEVAKLAMLDVPVPGTHVWDVAIHKPDPELWHFGLHQRRDIAEMLVAGHEYAYISDFCRKRLAAPIADEDFAVYGRAYAAPGGLRAGFELYRALSGGRATLPEIHELRFATAPDVLRRWDGGSVGPQGRKETIICPVSLAVALLPDAQHVCNTASLTY